MFFQEPTPDTSGYMIAGYAIAFLLMALYVVSIYLRNRNLHQDMTMLEEMEKPEEPAREVRQAKKSTLAPGSNKSVKPVTKNSVQK